MNDGGVKLKVGARRHGAKRMNSPLDGLRPAGAPDAPAFGALGWRVGLRRHAIVGWVRGVGIKGLLVAAAMLFLAVAPAHAQDYRFNVPQLDMQVEVNPDGTADLAYDITFANAPGADPIDIVDIGMPHGDYDIGNMRASMGGVPLGDIRDSEYVKPGVEVHLGNRAIPPGGERTLHFEATVPGLLFGDTTRGDYASMQITPTWFDPDLVTGRGKVRIAVSLPPGIPADAVLYQDRPFDGKFDQDGRTIVFWEFDNEPITGPHRVGLSFPSQGIAGVAQMSPLDLAVKWLEDNPLVRIALAFVFLVGLAFAFFRMSGGTGWSVFLVLAGISIFFFLIYAGTLLLALVVLPFMILATERLRRGRKRKNGGYLPAIAQVEGGGIKRGLTAPEAAVLLELPLHKVLSLVIFGLLKKGVLTATVPDPLTVTVDPAFADSDREARLKAAAERGTVLHPYEHPFLDELAAGGAAREVAKADLTLALKGLIERVAERVAGFDLSDTQDYYRDIVRRATVEAKSAVDLPEREKAIDRNFEWILIDDGYGDVLGRPDRPYSPRWWPRGPTVIGSPGGGLGTPSVPGGPVPGGRTGAGDVAASFAGWTENTMGSLATALSPSVLQTAGKVGGGVINLGGIDRVTMDVLEAMAEASAKGGGGGGGGGGGCACAGCACACACAGGGR